jgi:hypothetical protein
VGVGVGVHSPKLKEIKQTFAEGKKKQKKCLLQLGARFFSDNNDNK